MKAEDVAAYLEMDIEKRGTSGYRAIMSLFIVSFAEKSVEMRSGNFS